MKIDLESHTSTPANDAAWDSSAESARNGPAFMADVIRRWKDIPLQLETMDKNGISRTVISLTSGGAQSFADLGKAEAFARDTNDYIVENYCAKHPDRFSGFANIPLQRGDAAARELTRAVKQLGMVGAVIRGYTNYGDGFIFLDDPSVNEFWACAAELGVPIYLHPREPFSVGTARLLYEGYPAMAGSAWGFAMETATFAMRLLMSDIFDRNPAVRVILGHLGEGLSFLLPRAQHRLYKQREGIGMKPGKKPLTEYFRENFYVTTSGHFNTPALRNAIEAVGVERVMFSIDYPFEQDEEAVAWFDGVDLPESDKARIASGNARQLLNL